MATPTNNKAKADKTQELVARINEAMARLDESSGLLNRILDREEHLKDLEKKLRWLVKDVEESLEDLGDIKSLIDDVEALKDTMALRQSVVPAPASPARTIEEMEPGEFRQLMRYRPSPELGASLAWIHRLLQATQESNGPCPCGSHIGIRFTQEVVEDGEKTIQVLEENVCPAQWWLSQHRYHRTKGKGKEFLAENPYEEYIHWYIPT